MVPRSLLERRLEYGKVAGMEGLGQGVGKYFVGRFGLCRSWALVSRCRVCRGRVDQDDWVLAGHPLASEHSESEYPGIAVLAIWIGCYGGQDLDLLRSQCGQDDRRPRPWGVGSRVLRVGVRTDRFSGQTFFSACGEGALLVPEPDPGPDGNHSGYLLEDDSVRFVFDRPGDRRSRCSRSGGVPDYLRSDGRGHRTAPSDSVCCGDRVSPSSPRPVPCSTAKGGRTFPPSGAS